MAPRTRKIVPARPPRPAPKRRVRARVIVAAAAVALVGCGLAAWWYLRQAGGPPMPVILISIDTLRADHLPVYGYTKVRTPAIDALAADGIVFERAYAHAPQTLPSHASILTGQLPFETGVRDNVGFTVQPRPGHARRACCATAGYATGGVVSAYVLRKETGIARGFDFFDGEMPPRRPTCRWAQVQRDGADVAGGRRALDAGLVVAALLPVLPPLRAAHARTRRRTRFAQYAPYDGEIAYCGRSRRPA